MQPIPGLPAYGLQAAPSSAFGHAPTAASWDPDGLLGLGETAGSAGTLGGSASTLTASGGVGSTDADGFQDLAAAWGLGVASPDPATAAFDPLALDLDDLRAIELELGGQPSGSGASGASAGNVATATTTGRDGSSGVATAATGAVSEEEEKKERQRAQNRAKQARFRQRQKVRPNCQPALPCLPPAPTAAASADGTALIRSAPS